MAGMIHFYDLYDLRKYAPADISTFVDIGANVGTTAIMARLLFATARIIAFEPEVRNFKALKRIEGWIVECHQVALGNGEPLSVVRRSHHGMHRCLTEQELGVSPCVHTIPSLTLPKLFEEYKIRTDSPFIVKIDTEGGERFIVEDGQATQVLQKATQINLEVHLGIGGTAEQWNKWIARFPSHRCYRLRKGMQDITPYYEYQELSTLPSRGWHEIELVIPEFAPRRKLFPWKTMRYL